MLWAALLAHKSAGDVVYLCGWERVLVFILIWCESEGLEAEV